MKSLYTFIIILVLNLSNISAQKDLLSHFSTDVGLSFNQGKELSSVFKTGWKFSASYSFPVFKNNLRLNPQISFNYSLNKPNDDIKDNLTYWNLGSTIEYNPKSTNKTKVIPYTGICYLFGKNYLTPGGDNEGAPLNLFQFSGIGIDFGIKLSFASNVFLKFNYQKAAPKAEFNQELKKEMRVQMEVNEALYDVIEFIDNQFEFDNITFSVGYKF